MCSWSLLIGYGTDSPNCFLILPNWVTWQNETLEESSDLLAHVSLAHVWCGFARFTWSETLQCTVKLVTFPFYKRRKLHKWQVSSWISEYSFRITCWWLCLTLLVPTANMSDKSLTQSCVLQRQEVNPDCCQIDQYLNKTQFFFYITEKAAKGACLLDQGTSSWCCNRWRICGPESGLVRLTWHFVREEHHTFSLYIFKTHFQVGVKY